MLSSTVKCFTDHSKMVLLCYWCFVFRVCHAVLSVPCHLVVTCWERADLLALLCVMFYCVGVLDQVRSKAVVLLLLTFCLLLLPLWESVIVLGFVVRYFMSILVLQSSWWGRESWLLCLICLPGVSWWLRGSSSRCHGIVCSLWLWYFLVILTYYFWYLIVLIPGDHLQNFDRVMALFWPTLAKFWFLINNFWRDTSISFEVYRRAKHY